MANDDSDRLMINEGRNVNDKKRLKDFINISDNNCTSYLLKIFTSTSSDETIENMFRNSGKDYNDLGRFEECLNLTDYYYVLMSIPKAFPIPMSIGVCMPKVCSLSDFENFKPYFVNFINAAIPDVFAGIKGFDLSLKIASSDVHFEDA